MGAWGLGGGDADGPVEHEARRWERGAERVGPDSQLRRVSAVEMVARGDWRTKGQVLTRQIPRVPPRL